MPMTRLLSSLRLGLAVGLLFLAGALFAQQAPGASGASGASGAAGTPDRGKLRAFLVVTGFDKAIEGLQAGAMAGPGLAGDDPDAFGADWVRLAREIFDKPAMIEQALDMMEAVMPEDLVDHGAAFYASDLGLRLVAAENASIATDDEVKYAMAEEVVSDLIASNPERLALYQQMSEAIGGIEQSIRSVIEIQLRYLLAAMSAGSSDLEMSEQDLRAMLEGQAPQIAESVQIYAMLESAYTYREFSDAEVEEYLRALQHPKMQQVYEILSAIQFEIMADRYERLAAALADLEPQTDL